MKNKILPRGWVEIPTNEVYTNISLSNIKLPQKDYLKEGVLPVIDQGQDFIGGYSNDTSIKVDCELPVIVFGDHTKTIKFIDFDFIAGADGIKVLKPHAFLLPKLLYYFIKSFNLPDKGYARHFKYLQSETMRIPPLAEQKRIVHELDTYFEWLNEAETALAQVPILLKQFRQKVLSMAVSGDLTRDWREKKEISISSDLIFDKLSKNVFEKDYSIPSTWIKISSKHIFDFVTSGSRGWAQYYSEEGAIFIRITNLDYDTLKIDLSKEKLRFVNPPPNSEGMRTRVQDGDILISITAELGMIGIVEDQVPEAYVNQHVALARPIKGLNSKYLGLFLIAKNGGQEHFKQRQKGATKVGLNLEDIKTINFNFPPLNEQAEIAKRVEELFNLADDIEADYHKAQTQLKLLPQMLLQKAFRGELTPQYASDESAEILLEKIKEEKYSIVKNKKEKNKQLRS